MSIYQNISEYLFTRILGRHQDLRMLFLALKIGKCTYKDFFYGIFIAYMIAGVHVKVQAETLPQDSNDFSTMVIPIHDRRSNEGKSDYMVFSVSRPRSQYRFVVLADSRGQYKEVCAQAMRYCIDGPALTRIFTSIRDDLDPQPDFIVFGGDFIYGMRERAAVESEFDAWIDIVDGLMGDGYTNSKIYPVFGSHERVVDETNPVWSAFNSAFFGDADNRSIGRHHFDTPDQTFGSSVYYFDYANARFFVLNNDLIPHELGEEQFDWLKQNLVDNGKELNFFFLHEPAYGTLTHIQSKSILRLQTMDAKPGPRNDFIGLLGKNNASLLFSGHEHQYTTRLIDQEFANLGVNIPGNLVVLASSTDRQQNYGPRTAYSYNGDASKAPRLHGTYTTDGGGTVKNFDSPVAASANDAEELSDGRVDLVSSDLELMFDAERNEQFRLQTHVGMRWNVSIPQGATILTANIEFTADEVGTKLADVRFYGQAADATDPFTTVTNNLSSREKTSQFVEWSSIPEWNIIGGKHDSPDLSTIIQEVIDRPAYSELNLVILVTPIGSNGPRTAYSYDHEDGRDKAPLLHGKYTTVGDPVMKEFSARIMASETDPDEDENPTSNDAEELSDGSIDLASSDLQLMYDQGRVDGLRLQDYVGMRWVNVPIPQGANIEEAFVEFTAKDAGGNSADVRFYGEAADNPPSFTDDNDDISDRYNTATSVDWLSIEPWEKEKEYNSVDISSIIQEIVARPGYGYGEQKIHIYKDFYEVKTGSCGAPWSTSIMEDEDGNETQNEEYLLEHHERFANIISLKTDPESDGWDTRYTCSNDLSEECSINSTSNPGGLCSGVGTCDMHNQPNHYAVVDVNNQEVTLSVYGVKKDGSRVIFTDHIDTSGAEGN